MGRGFSDVARHYGSHTRQEETFEHEQGGAASPKRLEICGKESELELASISGILQKDHMPIQDMESTVHTGTHPQ